MKKRNRNLLFCLSVVLCLFALLTTPLRAACAYPYLCAIRCDDNEYFCSTRCDRITGPAHETCTNDCADQWLTCHSYCQAVGCFPST